MQKFVRILLKQKANLSHTVTEPVPAGIFCQPEGSNGIHFVIVVATSFIYWFKFINIYFVAFKLHLPLCCSCDYNILADYAMSYLLMYAAYDRLREMKKKKRFMQLHAVFLRG